MLYRNHELRTPGQLDFGLGLTGTFYATLTQDSWLIVPGEGGLPLHRTPGLHSIEDAWDNLIIRIEKKQADGEWRRLTDELE